MSRCLLDGSTVPAPMPAVEMCGRLTSACLPSGHWRCPVFIRIMWPRNMSYLSAQTFNTASAKKIISVVVRVARNSRGALLTCAYQYYRKYRYRHAVRTLSGSNQRNDNARNYYLVLSAPSSFGWRRAATAASTLRYCQDNIFSLPGRLKRKT